MYGTKTFVVCTIKDSGDMVMQPIVKRELIQKILHAQLKIVILNLLAMVFVANIDQGTIEKELLIYKERQMEVAL